MDLSGHYANLVSYLQDYPEEKAGIAKFIRDHEDMPIKELALKKMPETSWPRALILDQITARQKARTKIPDWHAQGDVIFPAGGVIEQCSSSATANFKANLFRGHVIADLTAGAGIDSHAFLKNFEKLICVEKDPDTAAYLQHNLAGLSGKPVDVITQDAETAIHDLPECDLIYIDPQRRDDRKKGKIRLEDTSPSINDLLPVLRQKTRDLLIKTSPALDIDQSCQTLRDVKNVYIVEWRGQCREVLYHLSFDPAHNNEEPVIHAVVIDDEGQDMSRFSFTVTDERSAQSVSSYLPPEGLVKDRILYEPCPAFMKSGGFHVIAEHFHAQKIAANTHLYIFEEDSAPEPLPPGRWFLTENIVPVQAKALAPYLPDRKANLTIRNFPQDIEVLKKKLKLKDGGSVYIFAATLSDGSHKLILCRKRL